MKHLHISLLFWALLLSTLSAQNKTWYFGNRCGLDFSSGTPVPVTTSMMYADEGCVTISDAANNVLFYTNGDTVWNGNNVPMPNGTGLYGQLSSSQSCLAVRKPGSPNIYYLFTTAAQGNANGLCWSEIDMSLNAGMGDVTANKNIQLVTPCCEKLAAVRHANGIDTWVVAHPLNSGSYLAYLVTAAGISTPVNSLVGGTIFSSANNNGTIGCMKFSCAGNKLAVSQWGWGEIQLYDFNNATGVVSNYQFLDIIYQPYGVEFSATGHYLYVTTEYAGEHYLFQFDVTVANIPNTEIVIDTIPFGAYGVYGLQLGPDHKIYGSRLFEDSLSVINNPDMPGAACGFVVNALYLGGRTSLYGLPNFVPGSYCIPANPDGVDEFAGSAMISGYPNPASDLLFVQKTVDTDALVTIYNSLGSVVYEKVFQRSEPVEIPVDDLAEGLYYVQVATEQFIRSKPVVISR